MQHVGIAEHQKLNAKEEKWETDQPSVPPQQVALLKLDI